MKLRTKTIITISLVSFLIFAALHLVTVFVIQPSFTNLENHEIEKSTNQALSTLNYRLSILQGQIKDYSSWDDTYDFVQDKNQDYVVSNLIDSTFENLNLNLIAIVDTNKSIVYCQSFDLNNSIMVQTSEETRKTVTSDNGIWISLSTNSSISGIMLIDNQPMFVATAPILTSLYHGPAIGGMLFGRYIDASETSNLAEITDLNFSVQKIADFRLQKANSQILNSLMSNVQSVAIRENGPIAVSGYTLINDIHSNPVFVLQITQDRAAYQQGIWVRDIFLSASILLSVFVGVGFQYLLEREIIKPLTKLSSYIKELSVNSNASAPKNLAHASEELVVLTDSVKDTMKKKFEGMNEVSRMVGHDLRNPLTGIKGASYILKKKCGTKIDEQGKSALATIDNCVEYSDKIVRDLLEYSCELKIDKIKTNPERLVNDSLSTLEVPNNIKLVNEVSDEFSVLADNGKVERVFGNLIKNAFDAMPDGGILHITSRKVNGDVEIAFFDTGIGMSEDTLKKLWLPFFTTKAKGMGVGLSICKKIVEAHGGRIDVLSTLGRGTVFRVFLPKEND
jgi:signal transduction histidine kinase